jgi:aromatic ring-cleaving dioxygenase
MHQRGLTAEPRCMTLVEQFKAQPSRPQFIGIAGPHPIPQLQAIFPRDAFTADVVPMLMFNRQGSMS